MEQRDFLKDQIEQMGKVLARILADFFGLKSQGEATEAIEITNQRLQSKLDIDIEKLTGLPKKELQEYLFIRHLTPEHLESLSDYLKVIGKIEMHTNTKRARTCLVTAIELLDNADEVSKTMSFDRVNKKSEIKKLIHQCG